jgi:hypothetical protein
VHQPAAAALAYQRAHERLSTEPRSPELPDLEAEMADLAPMGPGLAA